MNARNLWLLTTVIGLLTIFSAPALPQGVSSEPNYMWPKVWTFAARGQFPGNFQELNSFDIVTLNHVFIQGVWEGYDYVDSVLALKSRNDSMLVTTYVNVYCNCDNWEPYLQADDAWKDSMQAHPEWYLHQVDGDIVYLEPVACTGGQLNFTKIPMVKVLAGYICDSIYAKSPMIWDGLHLDYLTATASWYNNFVSYEGDSVDADEDEHADPAGWLDSAWAAGVDTFCATLRALVGDTVLIINNGRAPVASFQYLNGHKHEGFPYDGMTNDDWWEGAFDPDYGYLAGDTLYSDEPFRLNMIMQNIPKNYDPDTLSTFTTPYDAIGDLGALLEKGLVSALLGDGYYCAEGLVAAAYAWWAQNDTVWEYYNTAYWLEHYDELRGRLGTPEARWDSVTIGTRPYFTRTYTGGVVALWATRNGDWNWAKADVRPDLTDLAQGGSTFAPGDTMEITWNASDAREDSSTFLISLYLSRDGGITFDEVVVENATNTGSYEWAVTGSLSTSCFLRAVVTDTLLLKGKPEVWPDTTEYQVKYIYAYDTTSVFSVWGCGSAGSSSVEAVEDSIFVCPDGDGDTLESTITILDGVGSPVWGLPADSMYLVLSSDSGNIYFCSGDTVRPSGITDSQGMVSVKVPHIGGCGLLYVRGYVCGQVVGYDTILVNSPDLNASGAVDFFDTFKFIPLKTAGVGWCGDFDSDGDVDDDDQTIYSAHLYAQCECPGGAKTRRRSAAFLNGSGRYTLRVVETVIPGSAEEREITYLVDGPAMAGYELRFQVASSTARLLSWQDESGTEDVAFFLFDEEGTHGIASALWEVAHEASKSPIEIGRLRVSTVAGAAPQIGVRAVVQAIDGEVYSVDVGKVAADEEGGVPGVPAEVLLEANVPNPFNPVTTLRYGLPREAHVSLSVYGASGRLVRTLIDGTEGAGYHSVLWSGIADSGEAMASGVYFARLQVEDRVFLRKMVLVR